MLEEAREDPERGTAELVVELPHLYHHIDTAWNARESTNAVGQVSDTEFREWSLSPGTNMDQRQEHVSPDGTLRLLIIHDQDDITIGFDGYG
jgi:hypothetical protein